MNKTVFLLGNGVRENRALIDFLSTLNIPILTTFMGADLIEEDHPAFCGRPGLCGQRAANIIINKADKLFVYGARLDPGTIGFDVSAFAPKAKVMVCDVDIAELAKLRVDRSDWDVLPVDLTKCLQPPYTDCHNADTAWLSWCKALYARFRPELEGAPSTPGYVDPFAFISKLSAACQETDILAVGSSGVVAEVFMQSFKVKRGQRVSNVSTIGAMGADIPMAIGAAVANPGRRVICVTGDGGFMLNSQELEVERRLNLPITFFVFNNGGYGSIRNMQNQRFDGHHVGCDPDSGLTLPGLSLLSDAYGVSYGYQDDLDVAGWLRLDGPRIIEVPIDPSWQHYPRVASSLRDGKYYPDPLHEMTPKLPEDELKAIMNWGN